MNIIKMDKWQTWGKSFVKQQYYVTSHQRADTHRKQTNSYVQVYYISWLIHINDRMGCKLQFIKTYDGLTFVILVIIFML